MAPDAHDILQHVNNKGKGPALDAETAVDTATAAGANTQPFDTCVICLDRISEKTVALPCKHDQFDFPCLGTWLQQSRVCPLCKTEVKAIKYRNKLKENTSEVFHLPADDIPPGRLGQPTRERRLSTVAYHPYRRNGRHSQPSPGWGVPSASTDRTDKALDFRKQVYRRKMYSAYVGSNRISRYRNVSPQSFVSDGNLVNRARMFIRRELRVFDFLNPSEVPTQPQRDRRASNVEFLLEYMVGILKSIDLKGSTGQAEELLKDFLGRENSRLFLHELEAWLRSPYERLSDWDKHVQYGNATETGESSGSRPSRDK